MLWIDGLFVCTIVYEYLERAKILRQYNNAIYVPRTLTAIIMLRNVSNPNAASWNFSTRSIGDN